MPEAAVSMKPMITFDRLRQLRHASSAASKLRAQSLDVFPEEISEGAHRRVLKAGLGLATQPCLLGDPDADLVRCLPPVPVLDTEFWLIVREDVKSVPHATTRRSLTLSTKRLRPCGRVCRNPRSRAR
jgi:hypothetical protein